MWRKTHSRLAMAWLVLGLAATCLALPKSVYTSQEKGDYRYITANGLPNHAAGQFPNAHNPNTIREQKYAFRMPLHPVANAKPTPVRRYLFGVALNGVVLDPGTAEFWRNDRRSGWNIEAIAPPGVRTINLGLDRNNAHVQPSGAYHYHADPTGLIDSLTTGRDANHGKTMIQIGWAADGFPIYDHHGYAKPDDPSSELKELKSSYRLRKGNRPAHPDGPGGAYDGVYTQDYEYVEGSGDLDECNGRRGVTPEFPSGTYYYVVTYEFPYISRLFRGTPDDSFAHPAPAGGPGGPRPGGPGGPGGPPGPFGPGGPGRGRPPGPPPGPGGERP